MNIAELEKQLTEFFAARLGMTIDKEIFRGRLPPAAHDALACRIDGIPGRKSPSMLHLQIELTGRWRSRDDALKAACAIQEILPYYAAPGCMIAAILPEQTAQIYDTSCDARRVFGVSARCTAFVGC